ncbi:MAG: RiPP maturation radical SAM C-methyltransferase [Deltaproteobacteria bacterium]|nr:RiPP maturation radical SAM C-methyltransferase [Deltaproteobacteria bacterium]MBW1963651.1 RiPP maturation radical SAM C-methyltransferase [Deltaproteobacteria bacterium]MBW2350692.1 RiPP maturation radical SAM C-methyltransferase [Deltaproteobacteria bacterium]
MKGKGRETDPLKRIALVSTPWPLFSRPSIQLGTLKAYLSTQFPDLEVAAYHFYLKVAETIGYNLYQVISEKTWLAETVYATLLFPERLKYIEKVFCRETSGNPLVRKAGLKTLANKVKKVSDVFIDSTDWGAFGLTGFSVCLCQLTSTLYFIKRIKQRFPDLSIVIGGSMFADESTRNLFQVFPEVDFVVNGEGELPLSQLVRHLRDSQSHEEIHTIPGIVSQKTANNETPVSFSQMETLSNLPTPEYDDYFNLLKTFSPHKTFFPTLPAEISRGCWWRRQQGAAKYSGCAFCNLNLQWSGYRSKSPLQVVSEIDNLTTKHEILSVAFMDNLLPIKESEDIFTGLGKLSKDVRLFAEIRATTPRHILETMRAAGIHEVQIGIEALSTRLLKKLNKGTTAIQNLEIMKHCEELGIANVSNLILHFPGSDLLDVEETLRNLEFALPFRPLRFVHFWLGLGSPVWQDPGAFGIKAVFNHPNYAAIFPPHIFSSMNFMIQAYRGKLGLQKKIWQPVKKKVRIWKKEYAELHRGPLSTPILSFRDGMDFLIIRQKRVGTEHSTHRLVGTSRAIYLFCQRHRSLKRILAHFPGIAEDRILPFLRMMVDKKLMFEENGRYLSLAIPVKSASNSGFSSRNRANT